MKIILIISFSCLLVPIYTIVYTAKDFVKNYHKPMESDVHGINCTLEADKKIYTDCSQHIIQSKRNQFQLNIKKVKQTMLTTEAALMLIFLKAKISITWLVVLHL